MRLKTTRPLLAGIAAAVLGLGVIALYGTDGAGNSAAGQ
jgi:hypothetical protein